MMSNYYIAFITIVRREVKRFMRIWVQTLLPPVITMTLYFMIFGHFIGQRIGEMGGYNYIQYIAPGLIMMSVITNSYSNVCTSFFSTKFMRNIEEMLISPIPNYVILLGYVIGGILRGLITGLLVALVALYFTRLHMQNIFIMGVVIFLSTALFSLAGFINALFAKKFDDVSIIPTFILTPLTYLGGVFYSLDLLPKIWQHVSLANPIIYMVNAFRYGMLGVSDVSLWVSISMMSFFCILLYVVAIVLLNKGVGIRT